MAGGESVEVRVRPACGDDLEVLGELLVEGFKDKFLPLFGRRIGDVPRAVQVYWACRERYAFDDLLVAEAGGRPIGVLDLDAHRLSVGDGVRVGRAFLREVGLWQCVRAAPAALLFFEPVAPQEAYIHALAVDPEWRGRGVGWRLLEEAERWARARGKVSLRLHVLTTNRAQRLYRRFGFRVQQEERSWLVRRWMGIEGWYEMVKLLVGGKWTRA